MLKITNAVREELITELTGSDVIPLIRLLKNKKNVSEFKLAETMNITVNQTRNMLYRLYNYNLVTFTRKKDKKKGWYIYYWTLEMKSVRDNLIDYKKRKLLEFTERLARENEGSKFVCPMRCMRMDMENAMEHNFTCLECGQVMQEQNNSRTIDNLKERITELNDELNGEIKEYTSPKKKKKASPKKKATPKKKAAPKKVVKKAAQKKVVKKAPAKKKVVSKKKVVKKKK